MTTNNFNIEYNGISLNKDSEYKVFQLDGVLSAPIRTDSSNLLDQDGGVIYNQLYAPRIVSIGLTIIKHNPNDLFNSIRAFENAFTLTQTEQDLIISTWETPTTTKRLKARVLQSPTAQLKATEVNHLSNLFVQLYCSNPFYLDETDTILGAISTSASTGFPLSAPLPMPLGSVVGGTLVVTNSGVISNYAKFIFRGQLINPSVTNKRTGKSFSIDRVINSGSSLEVFRQDGSLFVLLDGVNVISTFKGEFFEIIQGDNDLVFDSSGGEGTLTIEYSNFYKSL